MLCCKCGSFACYTTKCSTSRRYFLTDIKCLLSIWTLYSTIQRYEYSDEDLILLFPGQPLTIRGILLWYIWLARNKKNDRAVQMIYTGSHFLFPCHILGFLGVISLNKTQRNLSRDYHAKSIKIGVMNSGINFQRWINTFPNLHI